MKDKIQQEQTEMESKKQEASVSFVASC